MNLGFEHAARKLEGVDARFCGPLRLLSSPFCRAEGIGHPRRRDEGLPLLEEKFRRNLARRFDAQRQQRILEVALDQARLEAMPVRDFMDLLAA